MGYIIYEGPSEYDGSNIVVLVTDDSANPKTGKMYQTWIMPQDVAPHKAIKSGDDAAVCGKCPLRPSVYKQNGLSKPCYVKTFQAPLNTWKKYKGMTKNQHIRMTPGEFRKILQGKALRIGSWGDPSSVPMRIWNELGVGSGEFRHTAYTHGHLMPNFDKRLLDIAMISLDKATPVIPDGLKARSFRVVASVQDIRPDEILCPAEKGKTTCLKCGLCAGNSRKAKNIVVVEH